MRCIFLTLWIDVACLAWVLADTGCAYRRLATEDKIIPVEIISAKED